MKTRIHVNQHNIRRNIKAYANGHSPLPVLTVKDYKQNRKCDRASLIKDGEVVATVVYSPDRPLACGAKVWIETELDVVTT